jgi:glucose/arabinose dehydrogenase
MVSFSRSTYRGQGLAWAGALALAAFTTLPVEAQERAVEVAREKTQAGEIVVERVAQGLEHPWSLAFLPDGRMLVTERPGRLRIVTNGTLSQPLAGLPRIQARGQGGLLDVVLDPGFARNRTLYLSFAEGRPEGGSGTSVAKARLNTAGTGLEATQVIFRQEPAGTTGRHFGARLVFDREGNLFVTLGDRGNMSDDAQKLTGHIGKVVRITTDGKAAAGNPFLGRTDAKPEIWSYGHRNIQGATVHPTTGRLWTIEHGARGGDELNAPQPGRNYGWPVITYGVDYSGLKIGDGTTKSGMEQPVYFWDPSIAPSGLMFYTGDRFPQWKGNLFSGALAGSLLSRLSMEGDRVVGEERLLRDLRERIRDVRQGPDGLIYILTDSPEGQILRLRPAR